MPCLSIRAIRGQPSFALPTGAEANKPAGMENAQCPLPPELLFLKDIARVKELPPDERLAWTRNHLEQIHRHADLLRQHGFDPDYMIALLQPGLERAEQAERELDRALDNQLHAAADVADAMRNLVDGLEQVVAELKASDPFHPDLPDFEDKLEQLREQYPKLSDD